MSGERFLELFRFIDWVMALPAGLERRFQEELTRFEAEGQMRYLTSIERLGIEQGIEQASSAQLEVWAERVLEAAQLEDVCAPV